MSKMPTRHFCYTIEKGIYDSTIISVFSILISIFEIHTYSLICSSHRSHEEYAEVENITNETFKLFVVTKERIRYTLKFVFSKVKPKKHEKNQSLNRLVRPFCAPYFCHVLQCNTVA